MMPSQLRITTRAASASAREDSGFSARRRHRLSASSAAARASRG
ncbi:MAG: hypothetical protein QOK26_2390, partial [Pseudonocardiales bacterium]|nr:hypothetical protein [Pseudonocardiales bacterium]